MSGELKKFTGHLSGETSDDFSMSECTYVRTYVRMYVCMCVCMYVRMYVCTYVCMYVCTYVYVSIVPVLIVPYFST